MEQETEAADAASDADPHEETGNPSTVAEPPKQNKQTVTISGKKRAALRARGAIRKGDGHSH